MSARLSLGAFVSLAVFVTLTGCAAEKPTPQPVAQADPKPAYQATAPKSARPLERMLDDAFGIKPAPKAKPETVIVESKIEDKPVKKGKLGNDDIGNDPDLPTKYNIERIGEVQVPKPIDPRQAVGLQDVPKIPPPPEIDDPKTPAEGGIAAGLKWLARHQAVDGHWSFYAFHEDGRCDCQDRGAAKDNIHATGLALLPFLGAGQTHKGFAKHSIYAKNVERSLKYLLTKQDKDGRLGENLLAHAVATLALTESYGLTFDPILKGPAQRAVNYLVSKQKADGSWDDIPKGSGAAAASHAWQILALKSGQMAGLTVPNDSLAKVTKLLDAREALKDRPPAALAGHLLARQYLGWGPRNPQLLKGIMELRQRPPDPKRADIEYYYFATQAIFHMGGEAWGQWNAKMRPLLLDSQEKDKGENADHRDHTGSWSPGKDPLAPFGGRVMQTALSLLILENYYRRREPGKE